MDQDQQLKKAFQEFVSKTEQGKLEGWIYTREFQEVTTKAQQAAFPDSPEETTYDQTGGDFHVVRQ